MPLRKILINHSCLYNSICLNLCISRSISESNETCILCFSLLHVSISGCPYITKYWHLRTIAGQKSYQIMSIWHLVTYNTTAKFNHYYWCYRLKLLDKLEVLTIEGDVSRNNANIPDWILVWMCQLKSLQKLSVINYTITEQSLRYVHCLNNIL